MKQAKLLREIGQIDEDLVLEAECVRFKRRKWKAVVGFAASFVLAACLAVVIIPSMHSEDAAKNTAQPAQSENSETEENFTFGQLSLSMTQDEVLSVLGDPEQISEDGLSWFYPAATVRFHSFDRKVWQIWLLAGCELSLPNGIGVGSSEELVKEAYPDVLWMQDYSKTPYLIDAFAGEIQGYTDRAEDTLYQVNAEDMTLQLGVHDGYVEFMDLHRYADPMLEALTVDSIIIYTPADGGGSWESMTVTGKAAKGICTVLTISEPEAPTAEKSGSVFWLDFGNGTALELYGNDHAAIFAYSGEALDPSRTDGLTWLLSGEFPLLDSYVVRAMRPETESEE